MNNNVEYMHVQENVISDGRLTGERVGQELILGQHDGEAWVLSCDLGTI